MRLPGQTRRDRGHDRAARLLALGLLLIAALSWLPLSTASALQETEQFVTASVAPADAALYFRVSLDVESEQWGQLLTLLDRADAGGGLGGVDTAGLSSLLNDEFGVDLFGGGEAAVIVSDTAINLLAREIAGTNDSDAFADGIGVAVALSSPAPELLAAGIRAAISSTATEVGSQVERSTVAGVTVTSVAVPADSDETPLAFARVGDLLLVAGFPADLAPAIAVSQGERPALSDDTDFQRSRAVLTGDAFAFGFSRSLLTPDVAAILAENGIPSSFAATTTPPAAFTLAATPAGIGLDGVIFIEPVASAADSFPAVEALAAAPADSLAYLAGHDLYGTGIFQALALLLLGPPLDAATPVDATDSDAQLRAILAPYSESFGTDLVDDLLGQLNGDFAAWVERQSTSGPVNALLTAQADDSSRVRESISQITFRIQSSFEGDNNITTRPIGEEGRLYVAATGDATVPQLEYGVLENEVVLGLGAGAAAIGTEAEDRLADSALFTAAMDGLPEANIGELFINIDRTLPILESATATDPEPTATPAATAVPDDADADPACGSYENQASAQAAYEAFAPGSFQLDRDFDGQACEDYFTEAAATDAVASPVAASANDAVTTSAAGPFPALGVTIYEEDGLTRVAARLLVGGVETEP